MSESPILENLAVTHGEVCDRGKEREENQDSVCHSRLAIGELFLVADGIGGYRGGAVASKMVVEGFVGYLASLPSDYPPEQAIREAAFQANASIYAAASAPDAAYRQMGSTVVLALLVRNGSGVNAWIGHIGDSRAYLAREGRLNHLTKDHSAVQSLLDCNLITPEQAANHPDASVLTRSLGHRPEVEIDISIVPLQPGDRLMLCSDGLWGYSPEPQIEAIVVDPSLSAEAAAQALLSLALAAGGHDNIGIELAHLNPPSTFPASS
jgi:serine/threonine protein phosphatase PrpC